MKSHLKKFAVPAVTVVGLLAASQSYGDLILSGSGSDGDGSFSGTVDFSLSAGGVLAIQLINTTVFSGQWQAGQLISGLSFDINGGSNPTGFSGTGNTTSFPGTGTQGYTVSSGTTITGGSKGEWMLDPSGSGINFNLDPNDLGFGQPNFLIIGADSHGGFTGAGTYNVGSSVVNHQPIVLGTADFTVTVQGLTSLSQIDDIVINYGTSPGEGTVTPTTVPVPESPAVVSAALMLIPLSISVIRVYSRRLQRVN